MTYPRYWLFEVIELAIFLGVACSVIAAHRYAAVRRWFFARTEGTASAGSMLAGAGAVVGCMYVLASFGTFSLDLMPLVTLLLLPTWPMSALSYLAHEPNPTVGRVAFPYPWIAEPLWRLIRN